MIKDAFYDENVDVFDDNLIPTEDDWKNIVKTARNLSLTINFDVTSLFPLDEECHRVSIAFAKLMSEDLNNSTVTQIM